MANQAARLGCGLGSSAQMASIPYAMRPSLATNGTRTPNLGHLVRTLASGMASHGSKPPSAAHALSRSTQTAAAAAEASIDMTDLEPGVTPESLAELERLAAGTAALDSDMDDDVLSEDEEDFDDVESTFASLMGSIDMEGEAEEIDPALFVTNFGLSPVTVQALEERGIKAFFPIQKAVFEPAMAGKDMIARAKTGSGKTLAFALPIVEKIMASHAESGKAERGRSPRCVVLAPTRELAKQVEREFTSVAPTLFVGCFYGGTSITAHKRQLARGVDVVVGTPGRVIDLIQQGDMNLSKVQYVILDEADQMLNVGFEEDVERILQDVPTNRQTLLFSATIPKWVRSLVQRYLNDPVNIDLVGRGESGRMNESITALAVEVSQESRRKVLIDVLTVYRGSGKAIVFTQRKRDCDEVASAVAPHHPCEPLHGDMAQAERERVLSNFRQGRTAVLVATDVAARGLDIPNVDLVVHHEPPMDAEAFLHRSGRTGRAGRTGTAIAMFTPRGEKDDIKRILRETKTQGVKLVGPPTPQQVLEAAARATLSRLDGVSDEVRAHFAPFAKLVLASKDPQEALEVALAALSGIKTLPDSRSLLTGSEGQTTLCMMAPAGRIVKPGNVFGVVTRLLGEDDAGQIGKIRMIEEGSRQGAAFDVPNAIAQKLTAMADELAKRGVELTQPMELAGSEDELYNDLYTSNRRDDRFGGGSRRGGGRSGGFNRRGGGRSDSYGSSSSSSSYGGGGGGYGGRSSSGGGSGGGRGGSWGGRDRDENRGGGWGSSDRFDRGGGSGGKRSWDMGSGGGGGGKPRRGGKSFGGDDW